MKYTKQNYTIKIIGHRYGQTWGGNDGMCEVSKTLHDGAKLSKVVRDILSPDFESALLSSDTYISVTLYKPNRRITRYFDIALFSSIADKVGDEWFTGNTE